MVPELDKKRDGVRMGSTNDRVGLAAHRRPSPRANAKPACSRLANEPDTFAAELDRILAKQSARAIVVAHTVTSTGRIVARFGGKVFAVDTGMQPEYVTGGRASALEIRKVVFTAVYLDRRDVLSRPEP